MKRSWFVGFVFGFAGMASIASAQLLPANDRSIGVECALQPSVGYLSGHTTYILDFGRGVDRLKSELEFPLHSFSLGGTAELRILVGGLTKWRFAMDVRVMPGDPHGTMYDTDWGYLGNGTFGVWSYTESRPAGHSFAYTFSAYHPIWRESRGELELVAGLDYFRHVQTIDNFEGWQIIDINLTVHEFSVEALPALDYRVSYVAPEAGLAGTYLIARTTSFDGRVLYGRVRATDRDDHLLRKKISEGVGWGNQVHLSLGGQTLLPGMVWNRSITLGFRLTYTSLLVKGTQYQQFYEDVTEYDPISGDPYTIPKGTRIDDLPHEFRSTRWEFGIRASLTL